MEKSLTIMVLDDDAPIRSIIHSALQKQYEVITASKPSEALSFFESNTIDIFICDIRLPEMDGLTLIQKVKKDFQETEIIMISSHAGMDDVIAAMRAGAFDFFKKPLDMQDILFSIERTRKYREKSLALKQSEMTRKFLARDLNQRDSFDMVSQSSVMEKIKETMYKVAQTDDTSVLITGESGTGKELVARDIHLLSARREQYFGAVNTSAIPEQLFESEFFGHMKGSFTGAVQDKAGWFEVADKGTLFLDEIGDMPQSLQVKLLRVLEERKFSKVGSPRTKNFDIRIISATNKNTEDLKNSDTFRQDLFYRICTFEIHIPPLRKRKEDIPLLTEYFILHYASRMKRKIRQISQETFDVLLSYPFPGNVRELRNLCERAAILCDNGLITADHFPEVKSNS
ncbi:MAG: sigma-54-dependent Fis family transcriptional regulator, partial [Bacteroidales bacterium]|nr:sigma-54-dependent Fis family transcriptional regulator [Bacteroidales bacterium]